MTIYGPKDAWPRHGNDRWNEALALARAKGWTLETFSSHRFGKITCPANACDFPTIDSSAGGTESFVRRKKRLIERCPHSQIAQDATVEIVKAHLVLANRYLEAARRLCARDEQRAKIEELWRLVDENVKSAEDALVADIQLAEWHEEDEAKQAAVALSGTGLENVESADPLLETSAQEVAVAEERLRDIAHHVSEREALVGKIEVLKADIETLRVQVGLGPADPP